MKAVVVPDSFKGSMSAGVVCDIIARAARLVSPECEVVCLPVADGGEGSADCFLRAVGGRRVHAEVSGPFFEKVPASFALLADGETAVVELASCAGLSLAEGRLDPGRTTTFGVGELMLAAVRSGAKKLVVCLGGSCTNDGGCGAAAACGIKFFDSLGNSFVPVGSTLADIARIDASGLSEELSGIDITVMCDVDNPLFGSRGAAFVFAPQKGADERTVVLLDAGLIRLSDAIRGCLGLDVSSLPGAGAAGGAGAGMSAFFGARLKSGIDTLLDAASFETLALGASLVITGEGRFDSQSLHGKVVSGVARRTKAMGLPLAVLAGSIEGDISEAYSLGVTAAFSILDKPCSLDEAIKDGEAKLFLAAENIFRLFFSRSQ